MKTGIIMEINERFLTLLTPEGEFLRAAKLNRQYEIGQEIDFYPLSIDKTNNQTLFSIFSSFKAKAAIAAALAIILVCSSVFNFSGNNEVYAYMSIDINPSIELAINDKFQVIEIKPFNEEGEEIVKHIQNWNKEDIKVITSRIVEEIKNQGYVKDNYEIIIATVNTKKDNKALEVKWDEEITEIKENIQKEKLEVKVMDASPNDRKEAKEKGLSIGSYKETQLEKNSVPPSKPTKQDKQNNETSVENQNSNTNKNKKDPKSEHSNTPPGQLKKDHESNRDKGSDQSNKIKLEKTTPPGQEKKVERDNNNNGNKQESVKKNNNEDKLEKNKQKNKDRDSSEQRGKGKEDQSKSNAREQNKEKSNSSQGNEKDKGKKERDKD